MKKMRGISLLNLVFFVPGILLSVFVWNDYNRYVGNVDDYLPTPKGVYALDEGKKAVGVFEKDLGEEQFTARLFDTATGNVLKEFVLDSDFSGELGPAVYQQGGVIIPTYNTSNGLRINFIRPSGEVEELARSTVHIPGGMGSGTYSWRGRLIVSGKTIGDALYLAQVKDGKLQIANFNKPDLLPARPVSVSEVHRSFENDQAVPIFSVSLKDDRTAFVSGILDKNGLPLVLLQNKEENTFEAEDRAGASFAKHFGFNNAKLVRENGDYPGKAVFYNAAKSEWGAAVPTPKPVYQAKVFLLNDQEVLIAGSTAEDELNGTVLGYVFNEKTGKYSDATDLLGKLSYEDLKGEDTGFHKEPDSDMLYYVNGEHAAAGFVNVKSREAQVFLGDQVRSWVVAENETRLSLQSFWNYVKQGNALVINWVVWLFIPFVTFLSGALLPRLLRGTRSKKIAEGVALPGKIVDMRETGLYVNERPQVGFTVRFEDEGQVKEIEIKQVISYLNDIKVGDPVMISYNRKKNKAVFITEDDLKDMGQRPESGPEIVKNAVLRRIEACGRVNRGQALQLHFTADGRDYAVPVVQPPGFEYRVGERASLALIQGTVRLYSYGDGGSFEHAEQISMEGEVLRVEEFPIAIGGRKLMLFEVMLTEGPERLRKINSLFVPKELPVKAGVVLPVTMRKDDYSKEVRLHRGKQGAAKVTAVQYAGTLGERPLATITAERGGVVYRITQTIEPVYGVEVGDDVWIAYDEASREAIIVNYSSM
ncbi:hypothetical protein LBW89_06585 [Paenibacillus sp. alder61]|uniref:Uncharacterized protein n=1 Tax=Paenibacillus faecis TaxID=862114 RepID=A0A5D0CKB5_9BACL|nr:MULTISPECIES: hypothetical protein [Paenibacillus]MCA1292678.1 hypothetical protein [Paenibacillus sp. alder61]TYA10483.1 hypothetical protein FRY98_21955 [Paenibacillus faecis]